MTKEVKPERTGWRDQRLSLRHRQWGLDCPAADIDFLLAEYDHYQPVALIEYKHEFAAPAMTKDATRRVLANLGNAAKLPAFGVRYADDLSWFRPVPLNDRAKQELPEVVRMSEKGFVTFLYRLRGRTIPAAIACTLSDTGDSQEEENAATDH